MFEVKKKGEEFFLPNFCALKTVLMLFIGAEMMSIVLILATGDVLWASWDELGLLSVFVQWIAFAGAGILCLSRKFLARFSLTWATFIAWCMVIATTIIIATIAQSFLIKINYQWGSVPETLGDFVIRCVLISGIISFFALRYFYVQQQWKERIQLESQARVEALQSRIRPHFLFNSMNIIASLIRVYPDKAEQAVEDLSELFRATLKETGSMVPLTEEWELCENYLRIEGLRLGDRLKVETDFSAVLPDAAIPMLTLQPLVENAIYHGIQALEGGGVIKIVGKMEGNMIAIHLSNPIPLTGKPRPSTGNKIAMANIRHRLNLLFGNTAKLMVNVTPGNYEVILTFPYIKGSL